MVSCTARSGRKTRSLPYRGEIDALKLQFSLRGNWYDESAGEKPERAFHWSELFGALYT